MNLPEPVVSLAFSAYFNAKAGAMNLANELALLRSQDKTLFEPAQLEVTQMALNLLRDSNLAQGALGPGDRIPPGDLRTIDNQVVALESLNEQGPLLLSFYRGGWCPYCSLELRAYQELLARVKEAGAQFVAVSPETPENLRRTRDDNELSFTLLHDPNQRVARSFGLVFEIPEAMRSIYQGLGLDLPKRHGSTVFELPIPATYFIDGGGTIASAFVDADYRERGSPADFLAAIERQSA